MRMFVCVCLYAYVDMCVCVNMLRIYVDKTHTHTHTCVCVCGCVCVCTRGHTCRVPMGAPEGGSLVSLFALIVPVGFKENRTVHARAIDLQGQPLAVVALPQVLCVCERERESVCV